MLKILLFTSDDQNVNDEDLFVEKPSYDVKCPTCLEIFDEPHQSLCCGNHVCKECYDKLMNQRCPLCRELDFKALPDKFFARQLLSMNVTCYNSKKGCEWVGELRMLKEHMEACKKNKVTCKHCLEEVRKPLFSEHVNTCLEMPHPCPHICKVGDIRSRRMQQHLESDCPLRAVKCDGPVPQTASKVVQQNPLNVCMTNYSNYAKSEDTWYSQPFYSHKNGYKLCLQVVINRFYANKVSILVNVLKGDYDHKLRWPLRANIEVALYNWRTKKPEFSKVLYLVGDAFCAQNTTRLPSWGKGQMEFIDCNRLALNKTKNTSYLEYNCLGFCIRKIVAFKTPAIPALPEWASANTFIVPSYTALKKKEKATFYGPPVYTGTNGYKLCPRVNLWGYGTFEKTHMSVCCTLMKGEHDHELQWPMEANLTIEMLNWRQDRNHKQHTFSFGPTCEANIVSRVLTDGIAVRCLTSFNLAAFTELAFNQNNNTEYLREDCLLFKVKSVTAYLDRGSYIKLPAWIDPAKGSPYPCFTLPEFDKRKKHNNSAFSNPFYSHRDGYKMQLKIDSMRDGHVGLYVHIMRGPNDNQLQWPFCGDIVLQLANWCSDNNHHSKVLRLNENCTNTVCDRVVDTERGKDCWGYMKFISHEALKGSASIKYLQDDCLHFFIKEMIVYSKPPPLYVPVWQGNKPSQYVHFSMSNFSKRKEFKTKYYSPAVFSHCDGYKMRLEVDPSNDSHLAVYVRLLKGENDNKLSWPFYGTIKIELLNHLSDSKHLQFNIQLHERIEKSIIGRVGNSPNENWGFPRATSHSALYLNKSASTEFLKYDCLCFRIARVVAYSHDMKVPRWQTSSHPASYTITNVSKRVSMNSTYYSPPFFAAKYKMCLNIDFDAAFNESEKAKYVSMYVCLLKGGEDESLLWPFCGDITVEILNWYDDHGHFKNIISLNYPDHSSHARPYTDKIEPKCYGKEFFVPISKLFSQFLLEDCMRIRISRVDCYSTPLSQKRTLLQANLQSKYLFEVTINSVSVRIRNNSVIQSSAFYTHENGYKLRLEVYPGGSNNNKGNVSIYARLLAGEHDSSLKWPMNVALKVELLNWISNSYHVMDNIRFGRSDKDCCSRVSPSDVSANDCFGYGKFCSHAKLFQKDRKIEYVQDDCIRVRVTNALIFSHNKGFFN